MKKCPFCAEQIQFSAIVCKHCHRDIPKPTAQEAGQEKKRPNWLKRLLIFFFVLALTPSAITGFIKGMNQNGADSTSSTSVPKEMGPNGEYGDLDICDINSYIAGAVIQGYAKYPDEAKQSCSYATLTSLGNHEYEVNEYVLAKNSFGVEGRLYYKIKMLYKGGRTNDVNNWENLGEPEITQ